MSLQLPKIDIAGGDRRYLLVFAGILIVALVMVFVVFKTGIPPLYIWLILLGLILALTLVISRAFTSRWLGIIVDERNKFSLSRLQMVMWTIVVLSAFVGAVLANAELNLVVTVSGAVSPAQVIFVQTGTTVLDALYDVNVVKDNNEGGYTVEPGYDISNLDLSATLQNGQQIIVLAPGDAASSVTQAQSADQTHTTPTTDQSNSSDNSNSTTVSPPPTTTPISVEIPSEVWLLLGISTTSLVASPLIKSQKSDKIQKNTNAHEASFSDLFRGEEGGNFLQLDLAKVQLFYFTLIVVGAYMIALGSMFLKSENYITSLPPLDSGVVAMLGVSHAGYLGNKAAPHPGGANPDDDQTDGGDGSNPPPPETPAAPAPVVNIDASTALPMTPTTPVPPPVGDIDASTALPMSPPLPTAPSPSGDNPPTGGVG